MKIKIEYEADVPDELMTTDFCNKYTGAKCEGISTTGFELFMTCDRFSVRLAYDKGRYRKCQACKDACEKAISEKRAMKNKDVSKS